MRFGLFITPFFAPCGAKNARFNPFTLHVYVPDYTTLTWAIDFTKKRLDHFLPTVYDNEKQYPKFAEFFNV